MIGIAAGMISLGTWVYLFCFHGQFWSVNADLADRDAANTAIAKRSLASDDAHRTVPNATNVIAVVPARDEADVIALGISSLLTQAELAGVVLVDDNSRDGTAAVAREGAVRLGAAERLTILNGSAVPQGWSGKVWAMGQGIDLAMAHRPDYLLLTDADIVHEPGSVGALVALAQQGNRDLVSFMAKLHCNSWVEKLLIPAFVFFFFKLYPPRWIADRKRSTAGAAGGCMLVKAETLARVGGVAAIHGEVIDDCALARLIKRSGGSIRLGLTTMVRSERAYSAGDVGRMISRTAFNQLRHSVWLLIGACTGLALLYVAPVLLSFSAIGAARLGTTPVGASVVLGVAAWLLMAVCYAPMVRFYGISRLWALTLPAAAIFYMGATVHSAVSYWRGKGGRWKGRVQDRRVLHS
jgi:hopene-associated glycosyltransferase HpnB